MSSDEIFVLVLSGCLTAIFWLRWYRHCQAITWLRTSLASRVLMIAVPLACGVLLWLVLRHLAAQDVQNAPVYIAFYLVLGAAWVGFGIRLVGLLGLSVRDDALERRNVAAACAAAGALVGLTLCYAGGNIGDGPGWWVVVFSAALSSSAMLVLWLALDRLTGLSEAVTVDRDVAAGLRLAGFFVAAGLILGRSVAGDWVSGFETTVDFLRQAWPALVLLAVAVPLEKLCRSSFEQPSSLWFACGVLPLTIYVGSAVAWLAQVGLGV